MTPIPTDQRRATRELISSSLSKDIAYQVGDEEDSSLTPRLVKVFKGQGSRLTYSEYAGVYRLLWHSATFVDNAGYIGSGDPNEASNISAINNSKNYHGKISTDVITALRNILQWMHSSTNDSYTVDINDIQAEGITTSSPVMRLAYSPSITGDFRVYVRKRLDDVSLWVDMSAFGIPKRYGAYGSVGYPISYDVVSSLVFDIAKLENGSRFTFTGWKLSDELTGGEGKRILLKQNGEDSVIYTDNGLPKIHAHWENAPAGNIGHGYVVDYECDFPISVSPVFSAEVIVHDEFASGSTVKKVTAADICQDAYSFGSSIASTPPTYYHYAGVFQGDDDAYNELLDEYDFDGSGKFSVDVQEALSEMVNTRVKDLNLNIPLRIIYYYNGPS